MSQFEILQQLSGHFDLETLKAFLGTANPKFQPQSEDYSRYLENIEWVSNLQKVGQLEFSDVSRLIVGSARMQTELTSKSGKLEQYKLAKDIIRAENYDAGLFIFYDDNGNFRFSLIVAQYHGTQRQFTNFRRYTYFIEAGLPNKTFLTQVGHAKFRSLENLLEAFSIEAVSNEFYNAFQPHFKELSNAVQGAEDVNLREDFALLLVIRVIFLGFVQKKGWLGNNPNFLCDFMNEYRGTFIGQDLFYRDWLQPLFFDALNNAPGYNAYAGTPFSTATKQILLMSPFLNGELFKRKHEVDDMGLSLPDQPIFNFMEFLFQYNFTVEENRLYDEELELNPEFLGLIFERLVNKANGAVYTPRTEVDLMCRLALVKWLEKNNSTSIGNTDLYNFLFRNIGTGDIYNEYQKQGDFSSVQLRELINLLENITVCDPAAGSGAFEVGMLQVLADLLENLYNRDQTPEEIKTVRPSDYELKKSIIAKSLYGVEVKHWAVWINQLRLWLTLFVDMPDTFKTSPEPLLPNLAFKVRVGDSLVQRVGERAFPMQGAAGLPGGLKDRLEALRELKRDFFYNRGGNHEQIIHEEELVFRAILDAQIDEKHRQISSLMKPKPKQPGLLESKTLEQLELSEQEDIRRKRNVLEAEITNLQNQKTALTHERPFLWSLEFSEIFINRGGFDLIISNPPYVRQEEIVDPNGVLAPDEYKQALKEMLLLDFSDYFARSRGITDKFKSSRKPDGRSDLFTYFYIRSLRLLNKNGIHVFICSNSWLDVGYGAWLQEFLLRTTPIHFIIDNHAKRSFASSDVNTIISVFGAPQSASQSDNLVRFVAYKKPFEEAIFAENLLAIQTAERTMKNDIYRVFPITVTDLFREGSESQAGHLARYVGDKWGGKYLRAPDIYFTILEKGDGKLVRLGDIADIRFGIKTGANDFFYLCPLGPGSAPGLIRVQNGAGWEGEIEEEYLKPVIKSPRECRTIKINPETLQHRLFMCRKSKAQIRGTKALEYIEWGERQVIQIGQGQNAGQMIVGYNNIQSVQGRRQWWHLGERQKTFFHFNYLINDVGRIFEGDIYASDNFFDIDMPQGRSIQFNNSVFFLFQNIMGRVNFGGGLIKIQTYELSNMLIPMINTEIDLDFDHYQMQSIFIECGLNPTSATPLLEQKPNPVPIRKSIDEVVFKEMGLTQDEQDKVYQTLCKLVFDRTNRANNF
jgi:hypothetical protein